MTDLTIIFRPIWKFLFNFIASTSGFDDQSTVTGQAIYLAKYSAFLMHNINLILFAAFFGSLMFKQPFNATFFIVGFLSFMNFMIGFLRCMTLFIKRKEILDILRKIPHFYSKSDSEKYGVKDLLKYLSIYRIHSIALIFSIATAVSFMTVKVFVNRNHKIQMNLPIDMSSDFKFFTVHLWIHFVHVSYQFTSLMYEVLQYGIITILAVEFRILGHKFEHLMENIKHEFSENIKISKWEIRNQLIRTIMESKQHKVKENNKIKLQHLKPLIKAHQELLEIRDKTERIFTPIFFIRLIQSSLLLCFLSFQVTVFETDRSFFMSSLIRNSRFIFFQCSFCQILKDANLKLLDGVYRCGWENVKDKSVKSAILIIIMRCQKSGSLRIFKTFEVSLKQYSSVMVLAYCFYVMSIRTLKN